MGAGDLAEKVKEEDATSDQTRCPEDPVKQPITMSTFLECLQECDLSGDSKCQECRKLLEIHGLFIDGLEQDF